MIRLRHTDPKNKAFLDATQLIYNVTIDYENFAETPHGQFKVSIKDKVAESLEGHDLFQFLVNSNSPSNDRNLKTLVNFETISSTCENLGISA